MAAALTNGSAAVLQHSPAEDRSSPPLRRVVIKLGTNVIMRHDGRIALGLVCGLVEEVAALRERGLEVLLVSSGAVGLGAERLGLPARPTELAEVQACAAVGQSRLMGVYEDSFARMGCRIAQVLLTEDDFRDATRHANLRRTLDTLLRMGVIPIVNENDTVSVMELDRPVDDLMNEGAADASGRIDASNPISVASDAVPLPDGSGGPELRERRLFGDNDKLSALLMTHIEADLLVLLSDVDGLFDRAPGEPGAKLIPVVREMGTAILRFARGGNGRGRGGMVSKLQAARMATGAGRAVVIANGRTPGVLGRILEGLRTPETFAAGTLLLPQRTGAASMRKERP